MKKIKIVVIFALTLLGGCQMKEEMLVTNNSYQTYESTVPENLHKIQDNIVYKLIESYENVNKVKFKMIEKHKQTGYWKAEIIVNDVDEMFISARDVEDLSKISLSISFDFSQAKSVKANIDKNRRNANVEIIYGN